MRTLQSGFTPKFALLLAIFAASPAAPTFATAPTAAPSTAATASTPSTPPPPASFTALPVIEDLALSPGGKMLAWLDAAGGEQHIVMYDIAAKKTVRTLVLEPGLTYQWLQWSDDDTLLYTVSITETVPSHEGPHAGPPLKREYYRMFSTGVTDKKLHMMLGSDFDFTYVSGLKLLKLHTSKPHTIIVSTYNWSDAAKREQTGTLISGGRAAEGWVWVVDEVDTHTGKGTRVAIGDQYTYSWIVNHDGKVLGRTEWYPPLQIFSVLVNRTMGWSEIYKTSRSSPPELAGLNSEETALLTAEPDTDGRNKLWSVPLDGSPRKVFFEDPNAEVADMFYDEVSGALQGVSLRAGEHLSTTWFDKAEQQRLEMLTRSFPKKHCVITSESANKQLVVIRVSGPSDPPNFYLVDLATHQATLAGEEYPDLANVKLGQFSRFEYKAHDGTQIPAFLTLPPNASDAPLPLVVLPHGGPASNDIGGDFEWMRQHLAIHGYAVFQPQFRGSTGFGDAFEHAGDRQWGLLMQDDLTDGVRALIDQGRVDAHRICIVGYSYGSGYAGYAALAGAAFTPDLYKCVVSVNGVSDLPRYLGYQIDNTGQYSNQVAYWRQHLGEPGAPYLVDRSPARAADRINAPVLLLYSGGDSIVPSDQSKGMAESLQKAGKNVRIIEIPNADHYLSHAAARVQSLEEIDKFLQDHL